MCVIKSYLKKDISLSCFLSLSPSPEVEKQLRRHANTSNRISTRVHVQSGTAVQLSFFLSFQRQRNTNRAMKTISSIKGDKMAIRSKRLELPKAPRLLANLRERRVKGAPGSECRPEVYHETLAAAGLRKRSVFFGFFLFFSSVLPQGSIRHS